MKTYLPLLIIALTCFSCTTIKYDLVIQNVGLFDGEQDRGVVNIGINADSIAAITTSDIKGDTVIAGSGKYLIPGLVNAHVHVTSLEDLQAGYDLGILTLLNMHTGSEERERKWKQISKDSTGFSVLYGAGHSATVPGGHPTQYSPGMETINDSVTIEQWVDDRIAAGADYIKVIRDNHGWLGHPARPTLTFEQIGQIIKYAKGKGYKVVVHAGTAEEKIEIAKFKPDGFVHMLGFKEDYPVSEKYLKAMAKSGVFIVTTTGRVFKPKENLPPHIKEWINNHLMDAEQRAEVIKMMHEHGIPILAGTDSPEGDMNFSTDYFYELELYKMAGLSNTEILKTATGNAAKAFDLPIGTLKVGSNANMILLSGSPIEDIENLKRVEQVWKNGSTK